jgi:hypothetical protein
MIFGFLRQNLKTEAVAVAFSIAWPGGTVEPGPGDDQAGDRLAAFRRGLYGCLTARADELFELADAVLCAGGPVRVLAGLSLAPGHRRGHGALYDAVNCGRVDLARLRWSLACLPLPGWEDGRIKLAVDVSNWLRPDAGTSPQRLFCHCYAHGKGQAQLIPGWRPGPGREGFGALAGTGRTWRMRRKLRRTRAGVRRPGGQGCRQGSRMSAARGRARYSWV